MLEAALNISTFGATENNMSIRWDTVGYNNDYWTLLCTNLVTNVDVYTDQIYIKEHRFTGLDPGSVHEIIIIAHSNKTEPESFNPVDSSPRYEMTGKKLLFRNLLYDACYITNHCFKCV